MSADSTEYFDGYAPRQLADVQRQTNNNLEVIVEPSSGETPFQNATDDSILQQIVAIFAEAVAKCENAAKVGFDMRDPKKAVGVALSAIVQLNALLRKAGKASVIPIVCAGAPNTLIPAGSTVSTADGKHHFEISEDVGIPLSGTLALFATCTTKGPVDPKVGEVAVISTPISGWTSVVNGKTASVGTEEESDWELRRRQQQSTNNTAFRHIEAIRAAVLAVEGVRYVRGYQNSTVTTDERGIPGKEVAMIVVGGEDRAIAEAMFYELGLSQYGYGSTTVNIMDNLGVSHPISFSRPREREVLVDVDLELVIDERVQKFPSDGVARITAAILDFAINGHADCEPYGNTGFPPGQDIIASWLATPINSIGGAKILSIRLGVDGSAPEDRDIIIAWNEIGVLAEERIVVNIV